MKPEQIKALELLDKARAENPELISSIAQEIEAMDIQGPSIQELNAWKAPVINAIYNHSKKVQKKLIPLLPDIYRVFSLFSFDLCLIGYMEEDSIFIICINLGDDEVANLTIKLKENNYSRIVSDSFNLKITDYLSKLEDLIIAELSNYDKIY